VNFFFLRQPALHEVATRIVTLREVVEEIKDSATKERLQVGSLIYYLVLSNGIE
jgi:hypothetical protein